MSISVIRHNLQCVLYPDAGMKEPSQRERESSEEQQALEKLERVSEIAAAAIV